MIGSVQIEYHKQTFGVGTQLTGARTHLINMPSRRTGIYKQREAIVRMLSFIEQRGHVEKVVASTHLRNHSIYAVVARDVQVFDYE